MSSLPQPSVSLIADTASSSGQAALTTPTVSEQLPQLDAYAFPIRPGGAAVNWVHWNEHTIHVAFDPQWFTARQAVGVVALVLGRRIQLTQAVTL